MGNGQTTTNTPPLNKKHPPRPRGHPQPRGPPPLPPANSILNKKRNERKSTWRNNTTTTGGGGRSSGGEIPIGYVCKLCNVPGHFFQNCPTAPHPPTKQPEACYATFDGGTVVCRSENPTHAWSILSQSSAPCLQSTLVEISSLSSTGTTEWNPKTHVRIVCVSDTHGKHRKMTQAIPNGDVLVHAGDFTNVGHTWQVKDVCDWMSDMPHKHKIIIAGNHDVTLDAEYYDEPRHWQRFHHLKRNDDVEARASIRTAEGVIYLEDESVVIEGYHFYGSPWQPEFCDWAFNLERGHPCQKVWKKIPTNTDVLLTHGPPVGHGDELSSGGNVMNGQRGGCVDLLSEVTERVAPLYHIFGHIHESYGATTNGTTTFVNASTCTHSYRPDNAPVVIDLPRL